MPFVVLNTKWSHQLVNILLIKQNMNSFNCKEQIECRSWRFSNHSYKTELS
jgi:hypothetical protein